MEVNSGGYLPSRKVARLMSTTFTDSEVNNCFSIYHTSWITSGPTSNFICDNTPTKAILFFFGCSELNSTYHLISAKSTIHLCGIQLFQKTLSKEKQTSHKPRPQGSMGSFKSVFIAAVKRELKKPRRRCWGQRLKNELVFYVRISRCSNAIYFVYLCQSYHETDPRTHR